MFLPRILFLSCVCASPLLARQAPATTPQTEEQKQQMEAEAAIRVRQAEALAKRLNDPKLFERGESRVYRGEYLTAISLPVGGIAAGPIQINGEARRTVWQIFKNFANVPMPNSFFAVRTRAGGKRRRPFAHCRPWRKGLSRP